MPRPAANRLLDMLTDPAQVQNALRYIDRKGVDRARFFGVLLAGAARSRAALGLSSVPRGVLPGVELLETDRESRRNNERFHTMMRRRDGA